MSFYNFIEFSQKFLAELQKDPEISSLFLHIDNDRFNAKHFIKCHEYRNLINQSSSSILPCHENLHNKKEGQFDSSEIKRIVEPAYACRLGNL